MITEEAQRDGEEAFDSLALSMKGITKRFPGTLAVDNVDFSVRVGEVHALIGENGAGKSTLMNVLAGMFADYEGAIFLGTQQVQLRTPRAAKECGIEMIHQELNLALPLSIAENLLAGRLPTKHRLLDKRAMLSESRRLLKKVGLELDPEMPVEGISQHEAQRVEIAKALGNVPCILVMDEPTSTLSRSEVERLFEIIRTLRRRGLAIVYVSHHLPEIMEIADRVTVMRDGSRVATVEVGDATPATLVEMMIGRKMSETSIPRKRTPGEVRFRVRELSRFGFFHRVSFEIRAGEVLGLGGLSGAGRSELARSLSGIDPLDEGAVTLDGDELDNRSMTAAMRSGIAYLTEDRKLDGLALSLTAIENAAAGVTAKQRRRESSRAASQSFERLGESLRLYPMEPHRPISQFSGGNQQKVLLAKWLATSPEVLILDEPTRGVDVGAKRIIHESIARLADEGKSVLLISSDLPELVGLSDRVLVMRKGHIVRELSHSDCTEESVLLAASGER